MRKAIVEDGKVINLIVHEDGELLLPQGQLLVDPGEQEVCMGDSYDEATGRFQAHNPLPALAVPGSLPHSGEVFTDTQVEQAHPIPAVADVLPVVEPAVLSTQTSRLEQPQTSRLEQPQTSRLEQPQTSRLEQPQTSTFLLCKREIHNRRQPAEALRGTLDTFLLAGRLNHSEYCLLSEMLDETP